MKTSLFVIFLCVFVSELSCCNEEITKICETYKENYVKKINLYNKIDQELELRIKEKLFKKKFDELSLFEWPFDIRFIIAQYLNKVGVKYCLFTRNELINDFYYDKIIKKDLEKKALERGFSTWQEKPYQYDQLNFSSKLTEIFEDYYEKFVKINKIYYTYCNRTSWNGPDERLTIRSSNDKTKGCSFADIFTYDAENHDKYIIHKIAKIEHFFNYINQNNIQKKTTIQIVVYNLNNKLSNIFRYLLEKDKKYVWLFNIINRGQDPLLFKYIKNTKSINIETMIRQGIDLDVIDDCNNTALHQCVRHNNLEFAKILINYGANINAKNRTGDTPLDYAIISQHKERYQRNGMINLLLDHATIEGNVSNDTLVFLIENFENHPNIAKLLI